MSHWIIAPVVLPAFVAALILFTPRLGRVSARGLALAANAALVALAVALLVSASETPPQVYRLGDWPAPFGIVLVLDRLAALMLALTAGLSLLVLIHAIITGWDICGRRFHALWLFQLMGLNGAFLTGDAFNLFVFFEVLLIASYGLMVHGGTGPRIRAGLQYIAVNLVGSTLFLFALATLYSVTGTLNMADLAVKLPQLPAGDHALIRVAAVLLMLVFAVKGALVPLHFWLPGTYAAAPGVVAALFAVMTKVGAYAALRFGTLVFPPDLVATAGLIGPLILPAALVTLVLGAIGVLGARSLPLIAAFAALASMGTVFIALSTFTPIATAAMLFYLVHSTVAGALLFLVADLARDRGAATLSAHSPALPGRLALLYLIAAIATAGLPPLSGFLGKLLVLQSQPGPTALVWGVILVTSFLVLLGLSRTGSALFWKPQGTPPPLPLAQAAIPMALAAATVALTLGAGPVHAWLLATAEALHIPFAYIHANALPGLTGP